MNRRLLLALGCAACLFGMLRPCGATETTPPPRSVLESVAELATTVTYTETRIPLGELIEKIAADTGVALSASREVEDEPVAVVVRDMPARLLLEELADLLDYRWRRSTTTDDRPPPTVPGSAPPVVGGRSSVVKAARYEIYQDIAARNREEALRRSVFAEVEQRFRQRVRHAMELAAMPPERLEALRDAAHKEYEELQKLSPEERAVRGRAKEAYDRTQERILVNQLAQPVIRSLALLAGRLSPQQWDALLSGREIHFSTHPRAGEVAMPADVAGSLRASGAEPQAFRMPFEPADAKVRELIRRQEEETQAQWTAAEGYRATVRVNVDRYRMRMTAIGPFSLQAVAEALGPGNAPIGESVPAHYNARLEIGAPMADYSWRQQEQELTPERQAALAKDPVVGVAKRFETKQALRVEPYGRGSSSGWWFRDLLPDLARVYGVQFLSDAYSTSALLFSPSYAAQPQPLYALLDRTAGLTQHWDRHGDLIRLRSHAWFLDRPVEFPQRLLRRWEGLAERYGALPLGEYALSAAALSDDRLAGFSTLRLQAKLPPDVVDFQLARNVLRLYAAMSTAQRQTLLEGRTLRVADMTPPQRLLFMAAVREITRSRAGAVTGADAAGGSLRLSGRPALRVVETGAGPARYQTEHPPLPARTRVPSEPSLREAAGLAVLGLTAGETRATPPPSVPLPPGAAAGTLRRPIIEARFHLRLGNGELSPIPLTILVPDAGR